MEHEVLDYIRQKSWEVLYEDKREVWLKECPFCHGVSRDKADKACSINLDTGQFRCFRSGCTANVDKGAGRGYNLWTLKKALGDVMDVTRPTRWERSEVDALAVKLAQARTKLDAKKVEKMNLALDRPKPRDRLKQMRGISSLMVSEFKLGLDQDSGDSWLAIPYIKDGKPFMVKYRSLTGEKRFRREPEGAPSLLFNEDALKEQTSQVYITEGEIDCITLTQLGFKPCVSIPAGAATFAQHYRNVLEKFDRIMLVYDNDGPGEEGAWKAAQALGPYRCYRVRLPEKDANETLLARGDEAKGLIQAAMQQAECMGQSGVIHLSEAVDRLMIDKMATDAGAKTGWANLDDAIGGIRSEFIVVSGDTKSGKTTWTNALVSNLAQAEVPCLVISPEMTVEQVARKQLSMYSGKSYFIMTDEERKVARQAIDELPVWIGDHTGHIPLEMLRTTIEAFIRRHAGKVVLVDHIDFILDQDAPDERREINHTMLEISEWPKKYGITLILVVHPTKLRSDQHSGATKRVVMNDIQGSSKIKQLAMMVLILHRDRAGNIVEVEDAGVRWDGLRIPGAVKLQYDPKTMCYQSYTPPKVTKGGKKKSAQEPLPYDPATDIARKRAGDVDNDDDDSTLSAIESEARNS